ncbi:hypothetical protein NL676_010840 [Syzygium grande]|nr:hypothetical protein NL676_010840 [Syzygium grande]
MCNWNRVHDPHTCYGDTVKCKVQQCRRTTGTSKRGSVKQRILAAMSTGLSGCKKRPRYSSTKWAVQVADWKVLKPERKQKRGAATERVVAGDGNLLKSNARHGWELAASLKLLASLYEARSWAENGLSGALARL